MKAKNKKSKKCSPICAVLIIMLFFIPSFMFGGEWIIHGQLVQRISDGARIVQLSSETCNLLGCDNLIWVGGGNAPGTGYATDYWAIYDMLTGECLFEDNMLNPRGYFSVVEIINNRLLIISGTNQNGQIQNCEILNLPALIETSLPLNIPTDSCNASSGSTAITLRNNNVLYGGGGQSDGYKWQIYDIGTETWGPIFYSIIGRHDFELELDPASDNVIAVAGNPTYGKIEIFNPATEEWTLGPSIPQPVYAARTEVVSDSEIALTGGYAWGEYYDQALIYNTLSNQITILDPFTLGRCSHGAVWIEPLQSLFIGGGYTASSATKTCYSYHLPTASWTNEGDLNRYQSWINFFLTTDFHVFAIGNHDFAWLQLYTWNYAPFISEYTYSDGLVANLDITAVDPNENDESVKLFFVEDADTTETAWTDFEPSGHTFEFSHVWNSSTSSHTVICEMKDVNSLWNVHNSFADSILIINVGVEPDPHAPEPILMNITPHTVKDNAVIRYTILHPSNVKIDLYNLKGQLVENLFDNPCSPGNYEIEFNAQNLTRGIYFLKIETETVSLLKKMVLIN